MEGSPLGPGGEDITWPDQVAPRGRKASSTRKIKPQTSNLFSFVPRINTPFMDYIRKQKTKLHVSDLAALTQAIAARGA